MADSLKDFTTLGSNFVRSLAGRQVPAVHEYAGALQSYADGKTDEIELGRNMFNLGFREAMRTAEDAVKFGFEWYSKALSVTGVETGAASSGVESSESTRAGAKSGKRQ